MSSLYNDPICIGDVDTVQLTDLHSLVHHQLRQRQIRFCQEVEEQIRDLENKLIDLSGAQLAMYQKEIAAKKEIAKLNRPEVIIKDHQELVAPILDTYAKVGPVKKIILPTQNRVVVSDEKAYEQRKQLVMQYINITDPYISITVKREHQSRATCSSCGGTITENNGMRQCRDCGIVRYVISSYKVHQPDDVPPRSGYESEGNFMKVARRYQGKEPHNLPWEKIKADLDNYFGNRAKGTKEQMYQALAHTDNTKYYDDVNLICYLYWGTPLPDFSRYERLMEHYYEATQRVYATIPDKERTSSLNAPFRLWVTLVLCGYPCDPSDFKIVTTDETYEKHMRLWKKMLEGAGLKEEWNKRYRELYSK